MDDMIGTNISIWSSILKGGGESAFTPAELFAANEQGGWYDPSDFSTLWQDEAGTTQVTATGQTVARIDDKSGNGNHLTQATAAARPTVEVDGSGNYYINHDGVDDQLTLSGATGHVGVGVYVAAALDRVGNNAAQNMFGVRNSAAANDYIYVGGQTQQRAQGLIRGLTAGYAQVTSTSTTNDWPINTVAVVDGEIEASANPCDFTLDATAFLTLPSSSWVNDIGTQIYMSTNPSPSAAQRFYGGLVVVDGVTAGERALLQTWLADKAGVTL